MMYKQRVINIVQTKYKKITQKDNDIFTKLYKSLFFSILASEFLLIFYSAE